MLQNQYILSSDLFAKALSGVDIKNLVESAGSAAPAPAAAAAAAPAAETKAPAKEEKKEESEDEEDGDMGFGLFLSAVLTKYFDKMFSSNNLFWK